MHRIFSDLRICLIVIEIALVLWIYSKRLRRVNTILPSGVFHTEFVEVACRRNRGSQEALVSVWLATCGARQVRRSLRE